MKGEEGNTFKSFHSGITEGSCLWMIATCSMVNSLHIKVKVPPLVGDVVVEDDGVDDVMGDVMGDVGTDTSSFATTVVMVLVVVVLDVVLDVVLEEEEESESSSSSHEESPCHSE